MKSTLAIISFAFICSCAPQRLVPYDFSLEKNNHQTSIELDDLTISLVNLDIKNDYYVFGLEVQNKSTSSIQIDPDRILKLAHYLSYEEVNKPKRHQEIVPIMAPEEVNQLFEVKQKNANTSGVLLFILGAAISTFDAVLDAKDYSKESWSNSDQRKSVNRDVFTGAGLLATDVLSEVAYNNADKAGTELIYLPDELFDKNVIAPGEQYYGKILFKKTEAAQVYHRIMWQMRDLNLLFDFRAANMKERRFLKNQGY